MSVFPNPYNPLQPTENPAYFFGREEALAYFRQNLVGTPHNHALVLTGRRGLGKSSLLRQLTHLIDDRYRICIINLGALELTSEAALIAGLVDEIRLALEQAEVSTYRLPDWPEGDEAANLREWFSTIYLDITFAALRYRRLVLALDDAHLLFEGKLPEDVLDYFAELLAAHSRLDLVFALDVAFEDRTLNTAVLNDPVLHYRLSELAPEAAEQLIRQPVGDVLRYEDGVIEQILMLADGHPFLLHSICRLLFRRSEERNHVGPITAHDLHAIQAAVEEQAGEIFAPLVQNASSNEQLVLVTLVELEQPAPFDTIYEWLLNVRRREMNKTQLASALRSLDYQGLVRQTPDGSYVLRAGLSRSWILETGEPQADSSPQEGEQSSRPVSIIGLIAVILMVGGLGLAALFGVFDSDDEPESTIGPTTTLSLNLEATRQSDYATQTEQARPTLTFTPTDTLTITPTETPSATPTRTPSPTDTPRPTNTPTAPPTDTPEPPATNTPRPLRTVTLSSGD